MIPLILGVVLAVTALSLLMPTAAIPSPPVAGSFPHIVQR